MNSIKKIIRKYYHEAVIVKDIVNIPYEHIILTNSNNDYNGLVIIMEDVVDMDKVIGYDLSFNTYSVISTDRVVLKESIDKYILNGISEHVANRYDMLTDKKSFRCEDAECVYCKNYYRPLKNIFI